MAVELKITIRDEERRYSKDFIIYEPVTMDTHDPHIDRCLTEVIEEFNGTPDDVKIIATMVL